MQGLRPLRHQGVHKTKAMILLISLWSVGLTAGISYVLVTEQVKEKERDKSLQSHIILITANRGQTAAISILKGSN